MVVVSLALYCILLCALPFAVNIFVHRGMPTDGLNAFMATDPYPPWPFARRRNPPGRKWRYRWLHRLRLLPVRLIEMSPFGAALAASPLVYNEFTIFPKVMLGACALAVPFYLLFSWQRRATLRFLENEKTTGCGDIYHREWLYWRMRIKRERSNAVFIRTVICSLVLWGMGIALPFLWKLAWADLPEVSL
ncbi:hypothetical protein [Kocuria sp.]|uniref:hypothetical protein n=1 Tax=Kocuria sp. TaxID=1871328 RepID=UPI0028A2D45B|nr:hypothetical protein [Kocuria sp.]